MQFTLTKIKKTPATAPGVAALVGDNPIRELRKKIGATQIEMATLLGVTGETVRRYEQGRHQTPRMYVRACLALADRTGSLITTPDPGRVKR